MTIKELRTSMNLTQVQASKLANIPLRTYKIYENDKTKENTIKYLYIENKLKEYGCIDEEHGILTFDQIKSKCKEVLENYDVEYCYLFGSYARGTATELSDVDLIVSTSITGLKFYGLVERLRVNLNKKVDVLSNKEFTKYNENKKIVKQNVLSAILGAIMAVALGAIGWIIKTYLMNGGI